MFHFCSSLFSSKQIELYDETFRQLVDSVLEGYNGMVFILIVNNFGNNNSINLQKKIIHTFITNNLFFEWFCHTFFSRWALFDLISLFCLTMHSTPH